MLLDHISSPASSEMCRVSAWTGSYLQISSLHRLQLPRRLSVFVGVWAADCFGEIVVILFHLPPSFSAEEKLWWNNRLFSECLLHTLPTHFHSVCLRVCHITRHPKPITPQVEVSYQSLPLPVCTAADSLTTCHVALFVMETALYKSFVCVRVPVKTSSAATEGEIFIGSYNC